MNLVSAVIALTADIGQYQIAGTDPSPLAGGGRKPPPAFKKC